MYIVDQIKPGVLQV